MKKALTLISLLSSMHIYSGEKPEQPKLDRKELLERLRQNVSNVQQRNQLKMYSNRYQKVKMPICGTDGDETTRFQIATGAVATRISSTLIHQSKT